LQAEFGVESVVSSKPPDYDSLALPEAPPSYEDAVKLSPLHKTPHHHVPSEPTIPSEHL
jgi:hypothetical protein